MDTYNLIIAVAIFQTYLRRGLTDFMIGLQHHSYNFKCLEGRWDLVSRLNMQISGLLYG